MAYTIPTIKDYSYKFSYKLKGSAEEVILASSVRTNATNEFSEFKFYCSSIQTMISPVEGTTLSIYRNAIIVTEEDGTKITLAEETLVHSTTFDFLDYTTNVGIIFSDVNYGTTNSQNILASITNVIVNEAIPCKYILDSLSFSTEISEDQHVSVSYRKHGDAEWIEKGTNLLVKKDGKFENPIIVDNLEEDTSYDIQIYHYELSETTEYIYHTCINPTVGDNPIIGQVEWNGRIVLFDAPNARNRAYPPAGACKWMFPMDNSTKACYGLKSSLTSSLGEDFKFEVAVSNDNPAEAYMGSHISYELYLTLPKTDDPAQSVTLGTLFGVTTDSTIRKTTFLKFYCPGGNRGNYNSLLWFGDGYNIAISGATNGLTSLEVFGTYYDLPTPLSYDKWYTLVMVHKLNRLLFVNITDSENYQTALVTPGHGVHVGNLDTKELLFSVDRKPFRLLMSIRSNTTDRSNVAVAITYKTYQYSTSTVPIVSSRSEYKILTHDVVQIDITVPNEAAYYVAVGYEVVFPYGGTVAGGTVNIVGLFINDAEEPVDFSNATVTIDDDAKKYFNPTSPYNITWFKTGDVVGSPVGGILLQDIPMDYKSSGYLNDDATVYIGNDNESSVYIAKLGFYETTVPNSVADTWTDPYKYLPAAMFENLGSSYKYFPRLKYKAASESIEHYLPATNLTELKSDTVRYLLEGIPLGQVQFGIDVGEEQLVGTTSRIIKSIKLAPEDITYDIDFENDFDNAIIEFKKRYYAKQKRWGGNMGGGTHGSLIYFNRGLGCLILEQHGDKYDGVVPAVAPAGKAGYGYPVSLHEIPKTYTRVGQQRTERVGGLIQSVDYHPYGMFDCWFKVPKGMAGLAICLWYFHYQEIYSYDKTFDFWTKVGWNGWKYDHCVKSGYGATWLVVNNEIDMELGSENTPYRTNVDPNTDASIIWYINGLSQRQAIGCTQVGANYGTWILDWEGSKAAIDAVTETDPQNAAAYLLTRQLKWIHITDYLDDVNSGATNRSLRFNNWLAEQWNDGPGVYGNVSKSALGKSELTVNNRTPLGELNLSAAEMTSRYVAKYYDDNEYHKWSIDWTKDYTRLYIDDELISEIKAFVPFNPMTMLVGCWFPSRNVYDAQAIAGDWGTWSGLHANWSVYHMYVKRIKFTPYTEAEVPTDEMRYDCETYAEDGLRIIK